MDDTTAAERWLPVVGFEGLYEVSNKGAVHSVPRVVLRNGNSVKLQGKPIRAWAATKGGYPSVSLCRHGKKRNFAIHTLMLEAFVGPRPRGLEGCHNDGDPLHLDISNLRWDTRRANMLDAVAHGTHNHARKKSCKYGHEFTAENTRIYTFKNGVTARFCRQCKRDHQRRVVS